MLPINPNNQGFFFLFFVMSLLSQMVACLTHALEEWTAAALQTGPGSVAHALLVFVEMELIVRTLMRWKKSYSVFGTSFIHVLLWISLMRFFPSLVWHGVWCLLQSKWNPALRQHRSRFPLPALSKALQGHSALRYWGGGCQEEQTSELVLLSFSAFSRPLVRCHLNRVLFKTWKQ